MAEDKLTLIYNLAAKMSSASDQIKEKHEDDYKQLIEYVKTSATNERILAAQQIASFFKHFPAHEDSAFESIVDLCESADVDVRKRATMAMIQICRDCKHFVSRAADILIQLYQTNQPSEVNLINQSLMTLLNLDIQKFLQSFFANFEDGNEIVRERALKFLSTKLPTVPEISLTKEVEERLMEYSKKAMEDVTKEEFLTLISILTKLKISKTASGQSMIVAAIKSQAELGKPFDANDTDFLDKFILCTRNTIPLLSQYNRASEYINFICQNLLPITNKLTEKGNDLVILQALAEMSPHIIEEDSPTLIDLDKCLDAVYKKLLEFLVKPEVEAVEPTREGADTAAEENSKQEQQSDRPKEVKEGETKTQEQPPSDEKIANSKKQGAEIHFTHIEYLLYTFHQLCRVRPSFLSEELFQPIRASLLLTRDGCNRYMERLEAQLKGVKPSDLMKEENKLRSIAIRTTKNITLMIKDLFFKPPGFAKSPITLSFKPIKSIESGPIGGNDSNGNSKSTPNNAAHPTGRAHMDRQVGHKYKYRSNYANDRFKKARNGR